MTGIGLVGPAPVLFFHCGIRKKYTVTYLKQYSNASIVSLEIELKGTANFHGGIGYAAMELDISPEYKCRHDGDHSHGNGMQHAFVVTPPLPDDLNGVEFNLTVKPFPDAPGLPALLH